MVDIYCMGVVQELLKDGLDPNIITQTIILIDEEFIAG